MADLRIDILGTVINISADEDPGYLQRILQKYRKKIEDIKNISGIKDPMSIAVLTGFILSEELEKAGKPANTEDENEAERLTLGMISRLDEMVPGLRLQMDTAENPKTEEKNAPIQGGIFKLKNTVKHYGWGSPEWIPALLGKNNPDRIPWAELWMGVNSAGPSRAVQADETKGEPDAPLLSELIAAGKEAMLGKECAARYGNLPFLFKVLAAAKPLSIQVHPSTSEATEGFRRENLAGIPLDAPNRNYRDPRHKPELICALSPFAALCGFRKKQEIYSLIEKIALISDGAVKENLENLCSALRAEDENPHKNSIEAFVSAFFSMDASNLGQFIIKRQALLERDFPEHRDEWRLCSYFASIYSEGSPGSKDPGIIAPLFLNLIELEPGEAIYIPAGVFHSYIYGMGIELMTDSDNVLRAGLTPKHVDKEEILRILNFSEFKPEILKAPIPCPPLFSYPSQNEEFTLSVLKSQRNPVSYSGKGPSIVLVTEGNVTVTEGGSLKEPKTVALKTGESAFIPAGKELIFSGSFNAFAASCKSS